MTKHFWQDSRGKPGGTVPLNNNSNVVIQEVDAHADTDYTYFFMTDDGLDPTTGNGGSGITGHKYNNSHKGQLEAHMDDGFIGSTVYVYSDGLCGMDVYDSVLGYNSGSIWINQGNKYHCTVGTMNQIVYLTPIQKIALAPNQAPYEEGMFYYDSQNKHLYFSTGIANVSDWHLIF